MSCCRIGAVLILLVFPAYAHAQAVLAELIAPWPDQTSAFEIRSDAFFQTEGESDGTSFDTRLSQFTFAGRWRMQPGNAFTPRVASHANFIDIDSDDPALPDRLVDVIAATAWGKSLDENWQIGILGGVGYAADTVFEDSDGIYGAAAIALGYSIDENRGFGFLLNYDGNRVIFPDVPLPAGVYFDRSNPKLQYTVGLPISSVTWKPDAHWTVQAECVPIFNLGVEVSYAFTDTFSAFGGYSSQTRAFATEDDDSDRLFFSNRTVEAGVRWNPAPNAQLRAAVGFAFDQELEIGWDVRDLDTVRDFSDEPYFRVGFDVRF